MRKLKGIQRESYMNCGNVVFNQKDLERSFPFLIYLVNTNFNYKDDV